MVIMRKCDERPVINLDGPEGNAFFLLSRVKTYGKQVGFSNAKIDRVLTNMKSGDYYNLVSVFEAAFGDYVDLVTENEDLLEKIGN